MDYYDWVIHDIPETHLRAECCDTPELITADLVEARKVFAAIGAYAHDDTPNASTRHGRSTYACAGPIAIGVKSYSATQRKLFCFNAPPSAQGELRVGRALLPVPQPPTNGAEIYVSNEIQQSPIPVMSNEAGFVEQTVGVPIEQFGRTLYYQYVWFGDCENPSSWTASDVIKIPGQLGQ